MIRSYQEIRDSFEWDRPLASEEFTTADTDAGEDASCYVHHSSGFDPDESLAMFKRYPITTFCGAPEEGDITGDRADELPKTVSGKTRRIELREREQVW